MAAPATAVKAALATAVKAVAQVSKQGFTYVLDRVTGEFISAEPFVPTTWASVLTASHTRSLPRRQLLGRVQTPVTNATRSRRGYPFEETDQGVPRHRPHLNLDIAQRRERLVT